MIVEKIPNTLLRRIACILAFPLAVLVIWVLTWHVGAWRWLTAPFPEVWDAYKEQWR